jgi:hypothetical protein
MHRRSVSSPTPTFHPPLIIFSNEHVVVESGYTKLDLVSRGVVVAGS